MIRTTLIVLSMSAFACSSDEDAVGGPADPDAGLGGSAGAGGGATGGGGSSSGGSDGSGGSAGGSGGSAGSGVGGSGGTVGPDSSVADAGNVDATPPGPDGSVADAGNADATAPGCSGGSTSVCVDYPGSFAVFLDAAGTVLHSGTAPIEYDLPTGGSVMTQTYLGKAWVHGIPPGTTFRDGPVLPVPPPPQKFQDIRITVPAPPVSTTVLAATGCPTDSGARFSVGQGQHTFEMDETCLENGEATVFVQAGGSYILVENVTVGAESDPVLDVALGAWQAVPGPGPDLAVTNLPTGWDGQVTFRSRYGPSGMLRGGTAGLLIAGSTGTRDIPEPTSLGSEWFRFLQLGEGTPNGPSGAVLYDSIGASPGADTVDVDADLLPLAESVTASGSTLSWSYSSTATLSEADWLLLSVNGNGPSGADAMQIVLPPSTTSITFPPSLPGEYTSRSFTSFNWASFLLEDHPSANGYAEKLVDGKPQLQYPGLLTDPLGRQTRTRWNAP